MTTGLGVIRWGGVYGMGWNPDTENSGLNKTYDNSGTPLYKQSVLRTYPVQYMMWFSYLDSSHQSMIINNYGSPIDDDLHKKLDLPNPAKKAHKKRRDTSSGQQHSSDIKVQKESYVAGNVPSRSSHAIMPIATFDTISPHTIHI
jgi:hypothetical protein